MEIFSVRSSQSLLFKNNPNNAKNSKATDIPLETRASSAQGSFQIDDDLASGPDFTAVSPSELRNFARQSYDSGLIDQDTYAAISEPLPMHTIDALGNIIDLTGVTDGTNFNFKDYYQTQLQIATSLGDQQTATTLRSIVSFLNG